MEYVSGYIARALLASGPAAAPILAVAGPSGAFVLGAMVVLRWATMQRGTLIPKDRLVNARGCLNRVYVDPAGNYHIWEECDVFFPEPEVEAVAAAQGAPPEALMAMRIETAQAPIVGTIGPWSMPKGPYVPWSMPKGPSVWMA